LGNGSTKQKIATIFLQNTAEAKNTGLINE